jgi:DNA invertase Pin-like site-specific DNA recombinase
MRQRSGHLDWQITDALKEAGCEKWFLDKITGSKAERKGLDEALAYVRPGDTFVVWKLDRAGRSLPHLIELLKGLKERSIEFVSLTEKIDTSTPGGNQNNYTDSTRWLMATLGA